MSATDLESLVTALEDVHLDVETDELDGLTLGLERRQMILDQIQKADGSALLPAARLALRERLEAVQARDAAVLAGLVQWHAEIGEALEDSARAKTAARGYRATADAPESGTRRTA